MLDVPPRDLRPIARQPQRRYLDKVSGLETASSGTAAFGLDPSRGQILSLLVQAPSLRERIDQGGVVGSVIICLGALALLIALERTATLTFTGLRVRMQARKPDKPGNNPLGRILKVYHDNPKTDVETLELKLSEAILKETPKINRLLMFLKIIAVVAPLLGLLGTVTGMINTFKLITVFGTGDPKRLSSGISEALVTTEYGLIIAVPCLLLFALLSRKSKGILASMEQTAVGFINGLAIKNGR